MHSTTDIHIKEITERFEVVGIPRTFGDSLFLYSQYDDEVAFRFGSSYRALAVSVVADSVLHIQMWVRDSNVDVHIHTGPLHPVLGVGGFVGADELLRNLDMDAAIEVIWFRVTQALGAHVFH